MGESNVPLHYVCNRDQARELIDGNHRFWVSNCGCREARGKCSRSRIDVCLQFSEVTAAGPSGLHEISRVEAEEILREAEDKHLVRRPFRDDNTRKETEGICFCCDDCCGYFMEPGEYTCDKGDLIETTDMEACTHCGECVEVCYFGARRMREGKLAVGREKCYGCGLCTDVCPEDCIELVPRAEAA